MAADNFDIQGKALINLMTCLVKYRYNHDTPPLGGGWIILTLLQWIILTPPWAGSESSATPSASSLEMGREVRPLFGASSNFLNPAVFRCRSWNPTDPKLLRLEPSGASHRWLQHIHFKPWKPCPGFYCCPATTRGPWMTPSSETSGREGDGGLVKYTHQVPEQSVITD